MRVRTDWWVSLDPSRLVRQIRKQGSRRAWRDVHLACTAELGAELGACRTQGNPQYSAQQALHRCLEMTVCLELADHGLDGRRACGACEGEAGVGPCSRSAQDG
jgi:hypothetical protein